MQSGSVPFVSCVAHNALAFNLHAKKIQIFSELPPLALPGLPRSRSNTRSLCLSTCLDQPRKLGV